MKKIPIAFFVSVLTIIILMAVYVTKIFTKLGIPWLFQIVGDAKYPPTGSGIELCYKYWHFPYSPMIFISLILFFLVTLLFRKKIDFKSHSAFFAFLASFLIEMYGAAFSVYVLFAALGHKKTHPEMTGWQMYNEIGLIPDYYRFPIFFGGLFLGIILIWIGWKKIHQHREGLVTDGIYAHIRHPQHMGIFLIAIGTFAHCPTPLQFLLMIILLLMYYRLSLIEDKELEEKFGEEFRQYKKNTGSFIPKLKSFIVKDNQDESI